MHTTQIVCAPPVPVPTGILQIGDDAPGIFIRGNDATAMAATIEQYFYYREITLSDHPPIKQLLEFLRSCDINAKAA